jgi:hypothetical protein
MQEALAVEIYQGAGRYGLVFEVWREAIQRHWYESFADQESPVRRRDTVSWMMGDHHHVASADMRDNCGAVIHVSED